MFHIMRWLTPYLLGFKLLLLGYHIANAHSTAVEITIRDLTGPALVNVNNKLQETQARIANPQAIKAWYLQSLQDIREALEPFGYFKPKIQSSLYRRTPYKYQAVYQISPGPLLPITSLRIQLTGAGRKDKALQRILHTLPIRCGQTMTTEAYQQAKRFVYESVVAEGYLDATWEIHTAEINRKAYTADIQLTLNTGPRYVIAAINFTPTPLNTTFLARYLPFKLGDPYRLSTILYAQDILRKTDYFQQISFQEPYPRPHTKEIPLTIALTPAPIHRYTAGIGFSTDTKFEFNPRIKLGWLARHVTATGHRAALSTCLSKNYKNLSGVYSIPGRKPAIHQYHIQMGITQQRLKESTTFTQQFSLSSSLQHAHWAHTSFISYQIGQFDQQQSEVKKFRFLMPGLIFDRKSMEWSKKDQYKLNLRLQGALHSLFSDVSFFQAEWNSAYLYALNPSNHIVLRARLGHTWVSQANRLPPPLLFYEGGYRLRGYAHQQLGPGCSVLTLSGEYRYLLRDPLYLATFLDAGNAANGLPFLLKQGAGIGLVWSLPVGSLEVGIAKALDGSKHPWHFILGFRTDFL